MGRTEAGALRVEGLTHAYGSEGTAVPALSGIDFAAEAGGFLVIVGPSGCGKSSLLLMMAGLRHPSAGRILCAGRPVTGPDPDRIGVVFQEANLFPWLTALDNVAFPLMLRRIPAGERRQRARAMLRLVGLEGFDRRYPHELSGGMRQRVSIARGLVQDPPVLLLDEPFAALDDALRQSVRDDVIDILSTHGATTVLVTHDQDEALSISDRVAVMSGGRIEQLDDAAALYRLPRTSFVAGFVGSMNAYRGRIGPDGLFLSAPAHRTGPSAEHGPVDCGADREDLALVAGDWDVVVRPEDVVVEERPGMPALPATLASVIPHGHFNEAVLRVGHEGGHMAGGGGAAHGAAGGLTVRAFVPADMVLPGAVRARFRRLLLYRDGVLMHEVGRQTKTASPPAPSLDGHRQVALRP